MYIIRLDDASSHMDVQRWDRMESILDDYGIKPIVGIIPQNCDPELLIYEEDTLFWDKARSWQEKGWIIALHGYNHLYTTTESGLNPLHKRSEFAGVDFIVQKDMIRNGFEILKCHGLNPTIFFAPSHTYDTNTLKAIKEVTDIDIISDTVANDIYYKDGFYYIPVQSGKVRKLNFTTTTFCLHPNMMSENDFCCLEKFIASNKMKFTDICLKDRKFSIFDSILSYCYFALRKIRKQT